MMLLGLLLHAAISYLETGFQGVWPFRDQSTSIICDILLTFIHVFRMPIFFVMAGFFAALLLARRGATELVRNRARRILVPFITGWIVVMPLTHAGFTFAIVAQRESYEVAWQAVLGFIASLDYYRDVTAHLWFLYYLILFYLLAVVIGPVVYRLPASWRAGCMRTFTLLLQSRGRPLYLAVPTTLTLLLMPLGEFATSVSFIPDSKVILAYGVFFWFGWLLFAKRDLLPAFDRAAWTQIGIALLLLPIYFLSLGATIASLPDTNAITRAMTAVSGALMTWLLVFGITGLFLRYLDKPSPLVRYIVDASYWLYLIHLPFCIWIPGLLTRLAWPAGLKVFLVLAISTPFWWLSYEFCVRNTLIGATLNGRRYPHGLPKRDQV